MAYTNELLLGKDLIINETITIHNPTVGEILSYGEQRYFATVNILLGTPTDVKDILHKYGFDYSKISNFYLFYLISRGLSLEDTRLLFGELDLSKLQITMHTKTNQAVLYEPETKSIIDEATYNFMIDHIRNMHGIERPKNDSPHNLFNQNTIETHELKEPLNQAYKSILEPMLNEQKNFITLPISVYLILLKKYIGRE